MAPKDKLVDLTAYENEWVALVEGKVIATAKNADTVYKRAKKIEPEKKIELTKLPKNSTVII